MDPRNIIKATGEKESEFFYRMAQYLNQRSDAATDWDDTAASKAYLEAAKLVAQAATKLHHGNL